MSSKVNKKLSDPALDPPKHKHAKQRVCEFLERYPDERATTKLLAARLELDQNSVDVACRKLLAEGLLKREKTWFVKNRPNAYMFAE